MKNSVCLAVMTAVLLSGFPDLDAVFGGAERSSVKPAVCLGLNYQGDRCECKPAEKCEGCPCEACTGGDQCACIKAVRESSGSITGQIALFRTKVKTSGPKSDKDVVVYLEKVAGNDFSPPVKHKQMDQKGLIFIPHVLAVQKGTTVEFLNSDNDKHNVYVFNDKTGKTEDFGTAPPGKSIIQRFDKPNKNEREKDGEPTTLIALCKLHLEMAAYVVVFDNPFFTIASIDGESQEAQYRIRNVPPGKYQLNIWHKKLKLKGGAREIVVEQSKATLANLVITKKKYAAKK